MLKKKTFFTRVGTYVQRGSMFCFVALVVLVLADTLLRILHYCPISPCFQHIAPLHAPLPCSLAPAVRPISTRFDARARWLRSHRTVLHWQVTKLHARVAVLTGLNLFLVQFHHAFIMCHQTACARCCTNRFKLVFLSNFTMLSLFACARCCPADRFKLVQLFLCRPIAP
jgi:hypothetical protein